MASDKGASIWLTSLPIADHSFHLSKAAFRNALSLRYGWTPLRLHSHCSCGASFTVDHTLLCPCGGFPTIRHNELRDMCAELLTETCHDVCIEPVLHPLSGEEMSMATAAIGDDAHPDIAASRFWGGRFQRTFFDVHVFNRNVRSNLRCLHFTVATNERNETSTNNEVVKWSMAHLHPWCGRPVGAQDYLLRLF